MALGYGWRAGMASSGTGLAQRHDPLGRFDAVTRRARVDGLGDESWSTNFLPGQKIIIWQKPDRPGFW